VSQWRSIVSLLRRNSKINSLAARPSSQRRETSSANIF
jgi:hypothetical protein